MDEMDRRPVGEDPTLMGNDVPRNESTDDRDVTARPVRDDDNPTTADYVGEAAGGVSGGLAGAAIGSIGGPVGTLIGGLAGVIGGWWAGRSIAEAAKDYGDADDARYRTHYESSGRLGDRSYDDVRPAYQLGHIASRNPDYRGRDFDTVESDLKRGWTDDVGARHGDWSSVRNYAREAYTHGSSTLGATSAGSVDSTVRTSDQLDDMGDRAVDTGSGIGDAARRGANKVADAVDNVKDRIDGNPASKPGPDPTDRRL